MATREEDREVQMQERRFGRIEQRFELAIFLLLIVPSMALSFFAIKEGSVSFALTAVATISRDIGLVALILFFLWRNREQISQIGWTSARVWREIGIGVLLFAPIFYGAAYLERALQALGFSVPATPLPSSLQASGAADYILAIFLVLVVAISEETIFRGYLMLRLRAFRPSNAVAILVSSAIFMLGHGYEGAAGVLTVFAMGMAYAAIYAWRKSLVASMTIHFLQDLTVIVLLPLFTAK
jgi:membrane protease YdiL (CAAX protease family)